ncbi:hypothetical protein TCAL_05449 [Tigriopus californicus]|uniref:Transmembrane protein 231 n=1 Tax=Tigriopus californicus TaxID=6832 RepID=A0A553NXE9_TIGCA|nr:hypothetical protein TCAL_05449 [Tigriopus californicus]
MWNLHQEPINIRYQASPFSKAGVFYISALILTFIPPLLIAYRSQGFWQRVDTYREQPEIHFQHELVLYLETLLPDKSLGWSTFKNYNQLLQDRVRVPFIQESIPIHSMQACILHCTQKNSQTSETDWNGDGKLDGLNLTLTIPIANEEQIRGITLLLLFDVKLHTSVFDGSGISMSADLVLHQKQPVASKGRDSRFREPIFDGSSLNPETFKFSKVLQQYAKRNLTTRLSNQYSTWTRCGSGLNQAFSVDIQIQYPEQTISYTPGIWQVLKWAWVQYLSIAIVFMAIFRQFRSHVFTSQVFPVVRRKDTF